jgi:hypothetical protein
LVHIALTLVPSRQATLELDVQQKKQALAH